MALLDLLRPRRIEAAVEMVEGDILPPAGVDIVAARKTEPPDYTSADRVAYLGTRVYGAWMTADEALKLSAVWACATMIAKSIAACDWNVFFERRNGDREYQRFNSLFWLLNVAPNDENRAFAVREAMLIEASLCGNAYAEIERDAVGRPIALWPLEASRCTLNRDARSKLVLEYRGDGGTVFLPYDDVFHLAGPGLDGIAGLNVVGIAARGLAHARAAEVYGASFYANGVSPGGILTSAAKLGDEVKKDLRTALEARHKGADKAFNFLLLDGGLSYQAFTVNNEQAQFIETRQMLVVEVCRWFGVPPHKIAHLINATFSNIEHQSLEFTRDCLTPWCKRLEQEANWKLATANSIWTEIDLEPLTWGDAKSRAETDNQLVRSGIATRNELRRRRGLNSIGPDGDKVTVEQGMTTLERIANGLPAIDPPEPPTADPPADPPLQEDQAAMNARSEFDRLMVTA